MCLGAGSDAGGLAVRRGGAGGGDFGGGGVTGLLAGGGGAVTGGRITGMGCVGASSAAFASTGVCARQVGICRVGSVGRGCWDVGSEGGAWMRRVGSDGGIWMRRVAVCCVVASDGGYRSGAAPGCSGPAVCRGRRCVGSAAGGASAGCRGSGCCAGASIRGRRTVGSLGRGCCGLRGRNSAGCHAGGTFSSLLFSGSSGASLRRF